MLDANPGWQAIHQLRLIEATNRLLSILSVHRRLAQRLPWRRAIRNFALKSASDERPVETVRYRVAGRLRGKQTLPRQSPGDLSPLVGSAGLEPATSCL